MANELTDDLVQQLLQLPYEQRGFLANTLIDSLHPEGEPINRDQWNAAWREECHRRLAEIDSGDVATIPADELIARMRAKRGD